MLPLTARRYTDAIVGTLKLATKPSPFYHPGLVAQVKTVSDRLVTAPGHDKGGSWITRNVPRPTIDSLWSTLEGRFTKFVSGEGEAIAATLVVKAEAVKATAGPIGPFTHFSSISPASTSGTLSRQASQSELASQDPPRPSSAAALAPIMGPPPVKRAPFKTHHSRSSSLGFVGYDYNPSAPPPWQAYVPNPSTAPSVDATPKSSQQEFSAASPYRYAQESSGYGEASYGQEPAGHGEEPGYEQPSAYASSYEQPAAYQEDSQYGAAEQTTAANDSGWGSPSWQSGGDAAAPRAPMFSPVAENFAEDDSGFISPMAAFSPSPSPGPAMAYSPLNPQSHKRTSTRDELDDLGIGNSKSRKPTFDAIDEQAGEGEDAAPGVPATSAPPKAERPGSSRFSRVSELTHIRSDQAVPLLAWRVVQARARLATGWPGSRQSQPRRADVVRVRPRAQALGEQEDGRRHGRAPHDCAAASRCHCIPDPSNARKRAPAALRLCYSPAYGHRPRPPPHVWRTAPDEP